MNRTYGSYSGLRLAGGRIGELDGPDRVCPPYTDQPGVIFSALEVVSFQPQFWGH